MHRYRKLWLEHSRGFSRFFVGHNICSAHGQKGNVSLEALHFRYGIRVARMVQPYPFDADNVARFSILFGMEGSTRLSELDEIVCRHCLDCHLVHLNPISWTDCLYLLDLYFC